MSVVTARDTWDLLTCDEVDEFGNRFWYDENGECHRENGPAIITAGAARYWCKHGTLHRENGPAYIHPDGRVAYWVDGAQLSAEQFDVYRKDHV